MKMNTGLMAGASRFAHFAGLTRSARKGAAADDTTDERDEDDDKNASEDDDNDDAPKGKRGRKAEEDDDGKDADDGGDEDDTDEDDDAPKGKRGRKAEDNDDGTDADDDDDEMKGKGAVAQARRREQARISHILGHKAAAGNPLLAVSLACETRMTRQEAVRVLKNQPAGPSGSTSTTSQHARQDRQQRNPHLGSDASAPSGKQAINAGWGAAFKKAGIKTRT